MTLSAAKLNKLSSGTTISYLSREQFENFSISIPVIEEQRKIASFLSLIEDSISNIQKQLEHTQQYKQGLLQQMFV
jgi:type I restriction enzyme S subunit